MTLREDVTLQEDVTLHEDVTLREYVTLLEDMTLQEDVTSCDLSPGRPPMDSILDGNHGISHDLEVD